MIALAGVAIQSKIYESAASLVYRGIRDEDGRSIVIKLLKQDYPSLQELTRYRQEYAITRSLSVEGVIKVYNQQDYQRTLIILLEDFGGESLEYWMRQRPEAFYPMPLSAFLRLAIDLTNILGRIHAANVIHKDINPGNIVLNPDTGVVKIIDFGIATQFNRTNPTFKSPHGLEGTLAYLSPEQTGRMNRAIDYRTDFYSLGVTFYELLTRQLPFSTTDILELIHCHLAKSPIALHELNATIPPSVSDIILKLMAKNAEDRYQSAWGIRADLEICLRQFSETGQINHIQLGLQDVSDQFHIPQKLYGRDAEIAALLVAFERVATNPVAGEDSESVHCVVSSSVTSVSYPLPEMMLVSGYAGIGKSVLVQELYKPITKKRGYFVSGKFDQLQRNTPYSAVVDALRKLIQQLLGEPEGRVKWWRSNLLAALGSNGQLIIDVIPEVELIVGEQMPVPDVGAMEAQNRFNRVFQMFIRVFCSKEHPLVIFLDDLQWVDSATLKLVELMLTDADTQYLFLIGAYRDNEVNSSHPLTMMLEKLKKEEVRVSQIALQSLELNSIASLIADTLYSDIHTINPLAELVLQKTGGNPFFVNEFLKTLYAENLLSFDSEHLRWQWNVAQIESENITDNVVELMLDKLKKLPPTTQQILQLAACIGANFDLSTLCIICERLPNEVFLELVTAVQAGLVVPIAELDEHLLVQNYKFLHDRVQQAAYALIDQSQKQTVHLQIGRSLLERTFSEQLTDRLFEIVDHLNCGIELVTDQPERNEIARLNLLAGQRAKGSIAYTVAKNYLATGRAWLAASSWQTNYDLSLELCSETAEVAFLCGDFAEVESWMAIVLQEAKTVLDTVKVYEVKIQTCIAQNQLLAAIDTGLQVLQQFGISFPEAPSQSDIQRELDTITSLLSEQPIENLVDLPEMTEPDQLAAMRILSSITIAAYIAAPDLMPLLVSKQVNLSIQYGNAFASSFAYALCGLILCGIAENIESGHQFGQLALRLLANPNTRAFRAKTLFMTNNCIIHWKDHGRELLEPFLEAYESGLETGDLEFAAYSAHTYCTQSYFTGKELTELEREIATYREAVCQIKQEVLLSWFQIVQQSVANLVGDSDNPTRLIGTFYNEENSLPELKAADNGIGLFDVNFNKLFLSYLFCDYAQAVENSAVVESYLVCAMGTPQIPLYYFYDSLARLAAYPESSDRSPEETLKKVAVNQEKMKQWAHHAPMNCLHKYHLVQAETTRVLDQLFEAEEFYEQAIQGARENEYIQEEALAYELAAKFYLGRGREKFAQAYMKEAHYCYERWGATAKVRDLETRYPQFFSEVSQVSNVRHTSLPQASKTTSNSSPIAFDLEVVLKASQMISSEIELDQLLHYLMRILIENAGAQTGYLILENSGEWVIEAACELNEDEQACATRVLRSMPKTDRLPESVIQYVIRTHESVILNNAACEGNFTNELYIQQNQTRSLLCMPLLNQSKLTGVLYLENQLATGTFTPERFSEGDATRTQVLHLLSTQAAIAIENAKLYSKLRASESRMAQFLEAIPLGVTVVDTAGRPYYLNQRATQLTGKGVVASTTLDQLTETYQVYVAGTDQKYPTEKLALFRALRGERTRVEDSEIHRNGTIIPVEIWSTPVFDEQGNVAYAIAAFQDITQRKQAEAALRESEAQYRLLFENNPNPMWIYDAQTLAFLMVNDAAVQYYGYSLNEFLAMTILDIRPDADASRLLNHMSQMRDTPYTHSGEWQHRKKDGTVIDVEITSRAIVWSGIAARFVLVKDITERKRAEQLLADYNQTLEQQVAERTLELEREQAALRQSEATNRAMISAIPDLLIQMSQDGMYLKVVRSGNFQPFNPQQLKIGVNVRNVLPPEIAQTRMEYTQQALQTGKLQVYEQKIVGDDYVYDQEVRIVPTGEGEVLVMVRDIGDRKRAEAALRDVYDELRLREQQLRLITDALPVCIFYTDANRRYRFVNQTCEVWFNCSQNEILSKHSREILGEAAYQVVEPYIDQVLEGQNITYEAELAYASGKKHISATYIPDFDANAQVRGYYGLITDISEQRNAALRERKRAEAATILEERNRMAREIHDTLAQAFTSIIIHLEAASLKLTTDLEAAQSLLNTGRDLARSGLVEARRSVEALRPQVLEQHDLYSALQQLAEQLFSHTQTQVICNCVGSAYPLETVVENNLLRMGQEALNNALKYARASEIRVELIYQRSHFILRIKDDGQGFIMNDGAIGGFGLLGMTERAEHIGAQLSIQSAPGQGTEITVLVALRDSA